MDAQGCKQVSVLSKSKTRFLLQNEVTKHTSASTAQWFDSFSFDGKGAVTLSRHIDPRPDHSQSGYNNLKHCALNNFVVFNFWSVGLELFDRQSFHKLRPLFN